MILDSENLLNEFEQLLDSEREALSSGNYEALTRISQRKLQLLKLFQNRQDYTQYRTALMRILDKSSENGLMAESALRFWRNAHQKLLHIQGLGYDPVDRDENAYERYREV